MSATVQSFDKECGGFYLAAALAHDDDGIDGEWEVVDDAGR